MYVKYSEIREYKVESPEGKKASVDDVLFDREGFKIKTIKAVGGLVFHRNDFLVPTEGLESVDSNKLLKVDGPFSEYRIGGRQSAELSESYPSGPIPGVLYADWSKRADSWLAREIEAVIEHHKRYQFYDAGLLSASTLLGYSLVPAGNELGQVEDIVLETKEWMIPYLLVSRSNNDELFLCPNFLLHLIDDASRKITTCIGSDAFDQAPAFGGKLSNLDEEKLWSHYLRFYGKEIRKVTGATHGSERSTAI